MVNLGYLLITAGCLAGAYLAVLQEESVPWGPWAVAVVVGVVGVALARLGSRKAATSEERLTGDLEILGDSLARVVAKLEALVHEQAEMDVYEVRHRIDGDFMEDLNAFVQARESLSHRYGVQTYANVMTSFASGERALNRAWSACTDGYVDAVARALEKALGQFREAQQQLAALS